METRRLSIRFYKAFTHQQGREKMVCDNAELMSRSLLHQQHLKCASFFYSATETEGANKVELEKSDVEYIFGSAEPVEKGMLEK